MNSVSSSPRKAKTLFRITQVIWYVMYVVEVLLLLRFLMKMIGANPEAGFSQFIYTATYVFAEPFIAVIPNASTGTNVFEWTTLLAILVYWLFTWIIIRFVLMQRSVSDQEAEMKLEQQENE
jgi:hypothetical protein